MTQTQATLLEMCRNMIGDTNAADYHFTNDQIHSWINMAILDISKHFPRVIQCNITTSANTSEYDLPVGLVSLLSVEYPQGEDPPEFLYRRARTHPTFWEVDGYYDILIRHDADSNNPPQLLISEKPGADETIRIEYKGEHSQLSSPTDETTILDRHVPLVPLFERWKAWAELATSEGMDPDLIKLLSATQEVNAGRAERSYYEALRLALKAESESGIVTGWRMDKWDGS